VNLGIENAHQAAQKFFLSQSHIIECVHFMKILQSRLFASVLICVYALIPFSAMTFAQRAVPSANPAASVPKLLDNADELIKEAFEFYKQKRFDEALTDCEKASVISPKDPRPNAIAGLVFMAQWKLKSASDEFAKSISLNPKNKQVYLFKARADQLRNAKEEALAASRKALEIDASFAEAYVMIGDILRFDEKRRDEAVAAYRSAIEINPNLPAAYENLAGVLVSAKDDKSAEEVFKQAMAADQKHMAGRFALGRLLVKQGRLKEARALWEGKTSDKDDTFPNFIVVLERAERLERAKDALAQKPDDPETFVQMGMAVMEGDSWVVDGRQERAIVYFKKALQIKPDFAQAQYGICKAYIQTADTFKDKNKNVDEELAKLRKLDAKLADELEDYRKNYSGGIKGVPANFNQ